MKLIFTDEAGKISLQKVAEMASSLQDALKNAPLEEIVAIMPTLQALVESAKSNDPSLQTEESQGDEDTSSKDMENKDMPNKGMEKEDMEKESMSNKDMANKDEMPDDKFEDSQKFKDAVNSTVSDKINTIDKARDFLPDDYNFIDSSVFKIQKDAVEKEKGAVFEDSEIPVAFKMLQKQTTQYKEFGDANNDAWSSLNDKEI